MFKEAESKIKHNNRCRQLIDFKSLQDGKMMPTDIDGMMEFKNKAYVFFELKYEGAYMPTGQRIALERLVNDTAKAGKKSICFFAYHNQKNYLDSIDAGNSIVQSCFYEGKWQKVDGNLTLRDCTNEFLKEFMEV